MHSVTVFLILLVIFSVSLYFTKPSWVIEQKDDKKVIKPLPFIALSVGLSLLAASIVEQVQEGGLKRGLRFSMASGRPALSFFGIDLPFF